MKRMIVALTLIGALVTQAIPLPEHPRPDWERSEWQNLNGEWEFGFAPGKFTQKIMVPFGWGCKLSGVKDEGDTGYYRRSVTIPSAWKGKRVFVVIGAADYSTTCTFAGCKLGKHSGGYTPFEFELTEMVKWGEAQTLEFEIWDPPNKLATSGHWLFGKQGYGNARGIWQTVYLEARGDDYIDFATFVPALDDSSVGVNVYLAAPARKATECSVEFDGKTFKVPFAVGQQYASTSVKLAKPRLWTLDDPYLYDVRLTFGDDRVKSYFGYRSIGVGKNPNGDTYITLNGEPIYLQLTLDQSYHPDGWYTFPSDEFMKNEILISKRLALSGNRVHIKVEIPRKLYWADKLGLLIQADVPCAWGEPHEALFEEHWKCFEGMVKRDFNHPSIYQWTLFNETWGLFSNNIAGKRIYRRETQAKVAQVYAKAKALDPTRIIEDNSECNNDHVATDVNSWHAYTPGYSWEECVDRFCKNTYRGSTFIYTDGHTQGDEPMMNSECGNVWGYAGSTGDCDLTWDYHLMINAFRRHLKCAGWLYTEHHDVINEWNGYVRFDRSPKYFGLDELADMSIKDFHAPAAIFFAGTRGKEIGETLPAGSVVKLPVGVSLTTDKYAGHKISLKYRFGKNGAVVEVPGVYGAKSWQCEKVWDAEFRLPDVPAAGCVIFTLEADGKEIARNFWCYSTVDPKTPIIRPTKAEWSIGTTNVLGGLKFNGFGKGSFEFTLDAPAEGGVFRAEVSSKRLNGKDIVNGEKASDLDCMLGGGFADRSRNANSYPQTSDDRHVAYLKIYADGKLIGEQRLENDPADHRGILSWLAQPTDRRLYEAGSYGWIVEAKVPASAVKNGKAVIRLESDNGLAVYGARFGRYPINPQITAK